MFREGRLLTRRAWKHIKEVERRKGEMSFGFHWHFWNFVSACVPGFVLHLLVMRFKSNLDEKELQNLQFLKNLEDRVVQSEGAYQFSDEENTKLGDKVARQKFVEAAFARKIALLEERLRAIEIATKVYKPKFSPARLYQILDDSIVANRRELPKRIYDICNQTEQHSRENATWFHWGMNYVTNIFQFKS